MSTDLLDALTATTLAGSLAILGVLVARPFIRRWFGAQVAYAIWIVVPLVAFALLLPAPVHPVATVLRIMQSAATYSPAAVTVPAERDWRPVLLLAWFAGAFATAAWFALLQRRYLRSLGRLRARDAGASRIVLAEANEGCPALVGAWRPRIVLPGDFEQRYTPRERELVLAHECVHFARGDARINALTAALRCLNWFNPLVHYAAALFRFDQELACDAAVITRFPEARRPYADAMLKTQLAGQSRQRLRLPVGCQWPSSHPLKERIAMLKQPLPTRARRAIGVALVALFGIGGAYVAWAAQSPRPVPLAAKAVTHQHPLPTSTAASYRRLSPPTYPASAIDNKIEGMVYVAVAIDADGHVTSATVDHVDPPIAGVLGAAATGAVKTWQFNAQTHEGKAVSGHALVPLRFAISDPATVKPSTLPPEALDIIDVVARPSS